MLRLVADGHVLGTICVNLAEVEAGLRQHERRRAEALLDRLRFLVTDREAAHRAGRYQAEWARRGTHDPDARCARRRDGTRARRGPAHPQHRRLPDGRPAGRAPGRARGMSRTTIWVPGGLSNATPGSTELPPPNVCGP